MMFHRKLNDSELEMVEAVGIEQRAAHPVPTIPEHRFADLRTARNCRGRQAGAGCGSHFPT